MVILGAIRLGLAIANRLKNAEDRVELIQLLTSAVGDGKISPIEWSGIGKRLGVFDVK
tara:strand:+ start:100 stop:273 length:174 start_codon:yes stop_codon:yes gene_type:complete